MSHQPGCERCGEPKGLGRTRYCDPCATIADQERRRRLARRPTTSPELTSRKYRKAADQCYQDGKRNGTPCWRCRGRRGPIDYEARRHSHPLSYTTGHLVERDAGGDLTDPTNLAPEHSVCNTEAGARYRNAKYAAITGVSKSSVNWGVNA